MPPTAGRGRRRRVAYIAGRSEANCRPFDESALWCVQVIRNLRSLGLTLTEIQDGSEALELVDRYRSTRRVTACRGGSARRPYARRR
jgi:hypothetical protein